MDSQEREIFIQEVVERVFKILPEVIGNLMKAHAMHQRLTEDFYAKHKEFKAHTDIVREVVAKVESENPIEGYDKILEKAIPEIKRQIDLKSTLTNTIPPKDSLNLTDNGML